jgi:hypothetical protein
MLLGYSGPRWGEATALPVCDIDLTSGRLEHACRDGDADPDEDQAADEFAPLPGPGAEPTAKFQAEQGHGDTDGADHHGRHYQADAEGAQGEADREIIDAQCYPAARFNQWFAVKVTTGVGTMWCAYALAALALVSLPAAITSGSAVMIQEHLLAQDKVLESLVSKVDARQA